MSLHSWQAWVLTGAALIGGVLFSVGLGDWSWFSRSGSAVVAIGVVLTSRQVFEHNRRLLDYQRRHDSTLRSIGVDQSLHDWADENSIRRLIRSRTHEEANWRSDFSGVQLLLGGTLIWGFGDLLGRLFG